MSARTFVQRPRFAPETYNPPGFDHIQYRTSELFPSVHTAFDQCCGIATNVTTLFPQFKVKLFTWSLLTKKSSSKRTSGISQNLLDSPPAVVVFDHHTKVLQYLINRQWCVVCSRGAERANGMLEECSHRQGSATLNRNERLARHIQGEVVRNTFEGLNNIGIDRGCDKCLTSSVGFPLV